MPAMANYYTIVTPEDGLPCTRRAYLAIVDALLKAQDEEMVDHGFTAKHRDGKLYLIAEEAGAWHLLPAQVLKDIGTLIAKVKRTHWEFGAAFTCSALRAGSHGGTAFRILADGTIRNRRCVWDDGKTNG